MDFGTPHSKAVLTRSCQTCCLNNQRIIMLVAFVSNAATAVSYFVITYQLIHLLTNSRIRDLFSGSTASGAEGKLKLLHLLVAMAILFASFIALCGLTHTLNAIHAFYPNLLAVESIRIVVLVLCAIVSVATQRLV